MDDEVHFNELNEKVHVLLDQLTPRQKEIFLLSREEGLTHEAIAKKLQISLNTVKKHMVNTLAFLRSHMDTDRAVGLFFVSLFCKLELSFTVLKSCIKNLSLLSAAGRSSGGLGRELMSYVPDLEWLRVVLPQTNNQK